MSEKYKTTEIDKAYFVTFTIVEWLNALADDEGKKIIIDSLKHYQKSRGLTIYAYCLMPNHVHLIAQSNGREYLSAVLRDLKKDTAKKIAKKLENSDDNKSQKALEIFANGGKLLKRISKYKIWQDGNRPIVLYSNKFIQQKIDYIHSNAVKAGLVVNPEDYLYSSARNYAGLTAVIDIVMVTLEWKTIK